MSLTAAQQEAIGARGNVLLVAGAGTGKTSTLVERVLACLMDEKHPASLNEILMVTFTEAAAGEMRHRIRARIEQQIKSGVDVPRWNEQMALFETAHIGTLHSFCLELIRLHFYDLELDPQLTVLAQEEAKLLADETLEKIFQAHYAGETVNARTVQQLIESQAQRGDQPLRQLVLRLHDYTQTLHDPQGWFASQLALFNASEPTQWRDWLTAGIRDWRVRWLPLLQGLAAANSKAAECAKLLEVIPSEPTLKQMAETLQAILLADQEWPPRAKGALRKPLEDLFEEARFLHSLARTDGKIDPLKQDWDWVRKSMVTLLELAREFTRDFTEAKRELASVDFHDLEQYALELLWNRDTEQPTAIAEEWREKIRFVFVDEYQDINDAQDAILLALSRGNEAANRFLVGDVKQSIYRFRLADPHIFQNYIDTWRGELGKAIPLVDNFRSHEGILHFVNSLFSSVMRRELGSVPYGDEAKLRFGDPENRTSFSRQAEASPRVELHLRLKGSEGNRNEDDNAEPTPEQNDLSNLEETAREARIAALRLRELRARKQSIWDKDLKKMRPVAWSDMAVLLRSLAGKAEAYAREFNRLGVPLVVSRGGFYESLEITDLLSLLQVLDNPLQDLPVLAVLRSPLVGLSKDDLVTIRLIVPKGHFWMAVRRFHETETHHASWKKIDRFLHRFAAWRRLARQVSLAGCLEAVLGETHYAEWLLTQARGEQRHANVQRLLSLAQQFDQFQRQGLFRFLSFIESQQAAETEPQVASVSGEDSVSLMTIHQSKGLEFPIVVVADLGKRFNLMDLKAEIILDSDYGLCPQIRPPKTGLTYPSLPYWLAEQRQKQETLGEEIRLLYVAMTRARDHLILTGSVTEKKFTTHWPEKASLETTALLGAGNYMDWIAAWWVKTAGATLDARAGENEWLRWIIYDDLDQRLLDNPAAEPTTDAQNEVAPSLNATAIKKLHDRLSWKYSHEAATHEPAKTSVSALRREFAQVPDDAARPWFKALQQNQRYKTVNRTARGKLSAAETGTAHHLFLQWVALDQTATVEGLRGEAHRMKLEATLTDEQADALNFAALARFWNSKLGDNIRQHSQQVRRELPFTARFAPEELVLPLPEMTVTQDGEFSVVQGVADLIVLQPREIWLVDFKTDTFEASDLREKVKTYESQIKLYARALSRIYQRPVTQAHLHFLSTGQTENVPVEN